MEKESLNPRPCEELKGDGEDEIIRVRIVSLSERESACAELLREENTDTTVEGEKLPSLLLLDEANDFAHSFTPSNYKISPLSQIASPRLLFDGIYSRLRSPKGMFEMPLPMHGFHFNLDKNIDEAASCQSDESRSSKAQKSEDGAVGYNSDASHDAITDTETPHKTMAGMFVNMGVWHCRCCTRTNQRVEETCPSCGTDPLSMGLDILKAPDISSSKGTALGYDSRMLLHRELEPRNIFDLHPERPDRLVAIMEQLHIDGLFDRCLKFPSVEVSDEHVLSCHTADFIEYLQEVFKQPHHHINGDTYTCSDTQTAARLSAGIVVDLTKRVMLHEARNAFAVVRPPGHHAEADQAMGFCMFNNVAIAAQMARREWGAERVLIVDWDIHHGNGTEHMFEEDPSVMYCSLHRFDSGEFYPGTGSSYSIGKGRGTGYTVNIAWSEGGMGDAEYVAAFSHVLMPVFVEFNPCLVLVSAGFDSALGDPLGGCKITPAGFAYMTSMLSTLADGKVVLALEGGYNLRSIARSASSCLKTLLGDPVPSISSTKTMESALASISLSQRILAPYWKCLQLPQLGQRSGNRLLSPRMQTMNSCRARSPPTRFDFTPKGELHKSTQTQPEHFPVFEYMSSSLSDSSNSMDASLLNYGEGRFRRSHMWAGRKDFLRWRWWARRKDLRARKCLQMRKDI